MEYTIDQVIEWYKCGAIDYTGYIYMVTELLNRIDYSWEFTNETR